MKIGDRLRYFFSKKSLFNVRLYSISNQSFTILNDERSSYGFALEQLEKFNPEAKQITSFPAAQKYQEKFKENRLVLDLDWVVPKSVEMLYESGEQSSTAPAVYVGGLSMLFQAIRVAEEACLKKTKTKAIFINDGQWPIYKQSGFQLHAHGTQYPDYTTGYLLKKFVESNSRFFKKSPFEVDYDTLHLPLGEKFFSNPVYNSYYYFLFFLKQIAHDLTSVNRISPKDKMLAKAVIEALNSYQELNQKIMKVIGKPVTVHNGRLFFSRDLDGIFMRFKKWREMGIPVEFCSTDQIAQRTILRLDGEKPIYAFGMFGTKSKISADGYVKPHLFETSIEYATRSFPENFEYKQAVLDSVFLDAESRKPYKLKFRDNTASYEMKVSDFQGSLGHAEVFKAGKKDRVYKEFTATGISMNFVLTVRLERLVKRKLGGTENPELVKQFILNNGILPSADLCNLHVTVFDQEIVREGQDEFVKLYCRVTEGANFNVKGVADKRDFFNVITKLEVFYEGAIELVSAGSCTRRTWLENMPRLDGPFLNGQSGLGLSFAALNHNRFWCKPVSQSVAKNGTETSSPTRHKPSV